MKTHRLIAFIETGSGVILLAGFLLMLAGGVSVWLGFPMSAPVKGLALQLILPGGMPLGVSPATVFLGCVALLGLCVALGWKKIALAFWLFAWLLLFYFAWQLAAYDAGWLVEYMQDSVVRGDIQRFNNTHALVNKGVEPSLVYITEFGYLTDRLRLVWEILGWGWILGVLGMVATAIGLCMRGRLPLSGGFVALLAIATPVGALALIGGPTLTAEYAYRQADQRLARGEASAALDAYRTALDRDGVLALSAPFLDKVSRAYLALHGEDDPHAVLALIGQALSRKALVQAEGLLNTHQAMAGTPFDAAMQDRLKQLQVQVYLKQGLTADQEANYQLAIAFYRQALQIDPKLVNASYFLGRALLEVRSTEEALLIAQALPDAVHHASIKSDFYGLIGDIYRTTGDNNLAREAYAKAYELDNKDNYRPMKELSGT